MYLYMEFTLLIISYLLLSSRFSLAEEERVETKTTESNSTVIESTNTATAKSPEPSAIEKPAKESPTAMAVWRGILSTPALVEYFKDTFDSIGVTVDGSKEQFTVTHTGTALTLSKGIAENIKFRVSISSKQVMNMVKNAEDNQISEEESWRILSVLFTPMTAVTLENKIFVN